MVRNKTEESRRHPRRKPEISQRLPVLNLKETLLQHTSHVTINGAKGFPRPKNPDQTFVDLL